QWDSPLFSVSGGSGSPNNLNIYLFDNTGTNVLSRGATNNINGDPIEVFSFQNNGNTAQQFNLVISNAGGPNPGLIKYVLRNFSGTIDEYDTASGTGYGHSNATGAMAVGAAFYANTPEFDQNPPLIESFSSAYPVPILFDAAGNRLETPIIRQKPNFVAPDGTNTTFFFGRDVTSDTDNLPNFFGTSAAAPHAAAVAALMLQAVPGADPTNIYSALSDTAIDMDDPSTSGSGLIQANLAVEEIQALEIPTVSITTPDSSASEEGDQGSFVVTREGGSIISDLTINYTTSGTAINRSDYSLSGIVTIPAGAKSAVIPIIPIDDSEFERNEALEVFVSSSSNYNLEVDTSIPVEIIDNDPAFGTLYVTIHEVLNLDDQEGGRIQGAPDFYTVFDIAGQRERTGTVTGSNIFPEDWTASYFNESGDDIIPITIDLKESDTGRDDQVDLSPRPNRDEDSGNLIFWYNARTNEIFGDVNGFGGEVLFASGEADGSANFDDNDAAIWFTVDFVS
ncbi:MAG: S8 family serine peptidase, partial [Cyanobacteria bacterium J06592_8]